MNLFQKAFALERAFESFLRESGKERKTTFYSDFSLAEPFGLKGIKDTYNRAFKAWKNDVEYMSEFVVVLNHKIWEHHETNNALAKLYDELWRKADDFCREHFKGTDLEYYFDFID